MRQVDDIVKELLETDLDFGDFDYYSTAASEFQSILADNPLHPLAYAGLAYCKAKMDDDPRTVFDLFFASLQFSSTNALIWSLIADYAAGRADAYAWKAMPHHAIVKKPTPKYELVDDLDDPLVFQPEKPPRCVLTWNRALIGFWLLLFLFIALAVWKLCF